MVEPAPEPTKGCRNAYSFACSHRDCNHTFAGKDLAKILRLAAKHWNKEHGGDLKHQYDPIDTVECGGHHITGNAYEVRKYHIYLTSVDMADRLGCEDGWLVPDGHTCPECLCHIPDPDARIEENPDDRYDDSWICEECDEEQEVAQRESENHQITGWAT